MLTTSHPALSQPTLRLQTAHIRRETILGVEKNRDGPRPLRVILPVMHFRLRPSDRVRFTLRMWAWSDGSRRTALTDMALRALGIWTSRFPQSNCSPFPCPPQRARIIHAAGAAVASARSSTTLRSNAGRAGSWRQQLLSARLRVVGAPPTPRCPAAPHQLAPAPQYTAAGPAPAAPPAGPAPKPTKPAHKPAPPGCPA